MIAERKYVTGCEGAAEYTGLSRWTIRQLVRSGKLRAFRPTGRRLLFDVADLEAFIRSAPTCPAPAA